MSPKGLLARIFTALMPGKARNAKALTADIKTAQRRKTIVVRTANDNACELCANAAGPHEWDDPDVWVTHPNCQCSWDYEDTADMSETPPTDITAGLPLDAFLQFAAMGLLDLDAIAAALADDDLPPAECFEDAPAAFAKGGKGNERALLGYWAKQMPKAAAGGGSDFNDCVAKLKGKPGIKTPEALCNWLHQRSRGAPPGKAPGEHTGGNHGHTANHSAVVEIGGVATFAGEAAAGRYLDAATREYVYPNALMWRAGDYPDKAYSMTREDNAACVAAFPGLGDIAGNAEHTPFLAGRAGRWTRAWIDPLDPDGLRGEIRIPQWLDEHLTDAERKPSVGWNRQTKLPDHWALTATPRVVEAALFNAAQELSGMGETADFGPHGMKHNTSQGQYAMQELHDTAERHGAVCNPPANMASRHESNAIQQAHDLAAQHGAKCSPQGTATRPVFSADASSGEGKKMSVRDKLIALFGGNVSAEEQAEIDRIVNPQPVTFSVEGDPAFKQMQAELAAERGKRITAEATAFADGLISAGRAMTAEREALIAKFSRAAADDYAHGTANFSGYGDAKSRVDEVVATETARPQQYAQAKPVAGESRVLSAHVSDPATFSGETQQTEEEERKANAARLRESPTYKNLIGTKNGTTSAS